MENYYVKIQGKANIPERLSIGHNYRLSADCSITSETKSDNENGEYDVVFKVEPITITIERDNGATVKAKDPRKNSTKIRNVLWAVWKDKNNETDFEQVYNRATNWIIRNAELIIDQSNDQARKT